MNATKPTSFENNLSVSTEIYNQITDIAIQKEEKKETGKKYVGKKKVNEYIGTKS